MNNHGGWVEDENDSVRCRLRYLLNFFTAKRKDVEIVGFREGETWRRFLLRM